MTQTRPIGPFPFIVGSPRSGTTLLRLMLGSHSELSIPEEAQFLVPIASHRRRYERGSFDTQRFVRDLAARKEFRRWGIPAEDVHKMLRALAPHDLPEAMRGVYALQAEQHGKTRYGDKTPRNVFSMDALLELFPESRFVHLIRDGRDVSMSLVDMRWFSGDLAAAALRWKRSVIAGRTEGARLGAERYVEVRYEDLIAEPDRTVDGICRFLSLPFEPEMVRYQGDFANAQGSQQHQHLALPPTKGLRDWRRDMSPGDLALVEASIGDLLDELHYERGTDQISLGVRSRARVREIREGTRVMVRRLGTSEVVG